MRSLDCIFCAPYGLGDHPRSYYQCSLLIYPAWCPVPLTSSSTTLGRDTIPSSKFRALMRQSTQKSSMQISCRVKKKSNSNTKPRQNQRLRNGTNPSLPHNINAALINKHRHLLTSSGLHPSDLRRDPEPESQRDAKRTRTRCVRMIVGENNLMLDLSAGQPWTPSQCQCKSGECERW